MLKEKEIDMSASIEEKYTLIDNETGEIVPINIRILGLNKSNSKSGQKFYKLMDVFAEDILLDKEIAGKAIKLLFWILKQLRFGEITFILNAKYASTDLEVTERTFYNWKKILEKKQIIKKITGELYSLNPNYISYGNIVKQETSENVLNNIKNAKILKGVNNKDD